MKILLDTNVLIASIISHGVCFELFKYCIRNHTVIGSSYIVNEFTKNLAHKFKYAQTEVDEAMHVIFEKIKIVEPENIEIKKIKDKDDLFIVGTAIAGKCACIISGDKHLQELKKAGKVDIIKPSEFLEYEVNYLNKNSKQGDA